MFLKIKNWFRHSETIAWARAQLVFAVGLLAVTFTSVDLQPYLQGKYLIIYLILNSLITEILRRKNTTTVEETTPAGETVLVLERTETVTASGKPVPPTGGDEGTTATEMTTGLKP